jgi:hypothetical protein
VRPPRSRRPDSASSKRAFATDSSGSTAGIALSDFGLISSHGEAPFKIIFVISEMLVIVGVLLGVIRQSGGDKFR